MAAIPHSVFSPVDRSRLYSRLYNEALRSIVPNCPGRRYSGQQVAWAKGQASRRFLQMERDGFPEAVDDA